MTSNIQLKGPNGKSLTYPAEHVPAVGETVYIYWTEDTISAGLLLTVLSVSSFVIQNCDNTKGYLKRVVVEVDKDIRSTDPDDNIG